ncbi:MAG: hypothetical protein MUC49_20440 [Raineya sp.]|jgi:hypothetical protein|nr:hypothetical protein [Raineya sp.]
MKKLAPILAGLCFFASAAMYQIGSTNSHLTELKDTFWIPLPLGIVFALLALKNRKSS